MRAGGGRFLPLLALVTATAIWGATFTVIQDALRVLPVFHLLAFRFALASLLLAPLAARGRRGVRHTGLRRAAVVLGAWLFAGFALQTAGLLWTTPSRSAFLTAGSALLVPAWGWATGSERARWSGVAGALLGVAGLWVLYEPWRGGGTFNLGDALTVACAVAFAGYIVAAENAVHRFPAVRLALGQFLVMGALAAPSLLLDPPRAVEASPRALAAIAVTGALGTAFGFVAQLWSQRHLSATQVSVVLLLEPVFAAVTAVAVGAEPLTVGILAGGGMVLAGTALAQLAHGRPEAPAHVVVDTADDAAPLR